MLIAAIVIYVILAILIGITWPLTLLAKAGPIGYIIVIAWFVLFVWGCFR